MKRRGKLCHSLAVLSLCCHLFSQFLNLSNDLIAFSSSLVLGSSKQNITNTRRGEKLVLTLTILSEVPPLEIDVPLSPTRDGRVWDIQLVTMAIVLSTAPILSIGTLMFSLYGAKQKWPDKQHHLRLHLSSSQFPLCSNSTSKETSQSASATAQTDPQEGLRHSCHTHTPQVSRRNGQRHPWEEQLTRSDWELLLSECLSLTPCLSPTSYLSPRSFPQDAEPHIGCSWF